MSTQLRFDLDGLRHAIESSDRAYRLAFYSDDAELYLSDLDQPEQPAQTLHGKPSILGWIEEISSPQVTHRVVSSTAEPDQLTYTEECHHPDGTDTIHSCRAELRRGQICKEQVTMRRSTHRDPASTMGRRRPGARLPMTDDDPPTSSAPTSAAAGVPPRSWELPGNFWG